ncbi:multidrug effflux MFS transporter [Zunongwangia sp. HRR-M8]|uniref:multidrug effflux MFS transporter n=1 Tax=Zunongwangia sp. HRR-M8 TaxID=3015170 RepID=UPI0022DDBA22|nr:multidrug effflux MFS transporter [Zunongwangia sp. HRR-M8]WBL21702.1 multidrug effflux MFS transporter [Zunongwangia sp. HRR-M8]
MNYTPGERNKKKEYIILVVLGTLIALGPFSIDSYLPGFENIAEDFNITVSRVGLTLTSYFIGISLGQMAYGPIMDKFGRKRPLQIGLLVYILAAAACYFSGNLTSLIIARFFLALGASAGMVASKAIVRDIFPVEEVAGAISILMLIMGGAPIIAPTIGGFIIQSYGWPAVFMFMGAFALLMFISVSSFLPESITPDNKVQLSPKSVLQNYYEILTHSKFLNFAFAGSFAIGAMFAYISSAPKLFMNIFDLNQSEFGILFGVNAGGLILGSQINRIVLKKFSTLNITLFNSVILVILSVFFLIDGILGPDFYTSLVIIFLILFLLGFQNPNTTALSLEPFSKRAGRASALIGSLKMVLGALASFVVSLFHSNSIVPLGIILITALAISSLLLFQFYFNQKKQIGIKS